MKNLKQLVERISTMNLSDAAEAEPWLRAYESNDWQSYLGDIPEGANNLFLLHNRRVRLMLIRWEGHSRSTLHGHSNRGCLLKVLSGMLLETRHDAFEPGRIIGKHQLFRGDMSFIHDAFAYHVVENPLPEPAVSLHLYAPGIKTANTVASSPQPMWRMDVENN